MELLTFSTMFALGCSRSHLALTLEMYLYTKSFALDIHNVNALIVEKSTQMPLVALDLEARDIFR